MRVSGIVVGAVLLVGTAGAAYSADDTTINFTGLFQINALSPGCGNNDYFRPGQQGNIIYRYKSSAADPSDVVILFFDRGTYRMFSRATNGSLNGQTASDNQMIAGNGIYSANSTGSSNLVIQSTNPNYVVATTNNIKINGPIDNFFFNPNCTVTIKSVLMKNFKQ